MPFRTAGSELRTTGVAASSGMETGKQDAPGKRPAWQRFLPITVIAIGALLAVTLAGDLLSFDTVRENREALLGWRDRNATVAALVFAAIYITVVAFSVPGAIWLTLGGGFVFGAVLATGLTLVSATTGATLIFLAARSSLGSALHERAGPWLRRVDQEVGQGEVSFLLAIRLIPIIPFFVANIAPALVKVRLSTFVWTTFAGIAPATAIIASAGAGLGEILDQGGEPNPRMILEPHVLLPLLGLAVLAMMPVVLRKLRGR
jgi:uncharacterized membrane protein YdjX (TVP38/TMEM64 family)